MINIDNCEKYPKPGNEFLKLYIDFSLLEKLELPEFVIDDIKNETSQFKRWGRNASISYIYHKNYYEKYYINLNFESNSIDKLNGMTDYYYADLKNVDIRYMDHDDVINYHYSKN